LFRERNPGEIATGIAFATTFQVLAMKIINKGLKIVFIFHPPQPLPSREGHIYYSLPWREKARVRGIMYVFTIMRLIL